ncbi:MAG: ferrochelatase [Anaerolineae bacterium]|nr:ferrochelatase [Anaerolineae bacterium]
MTAAPTFDAVFVVSFGGPEGMDDVMPFLENVLRGRNVPRERMLEVAHHYELFDGVSPINTQNRALVVALEDELETHHLNLPVYWGNRNWHPMLVDTLRQMQADGIKHALAFITSAFSSYSGCRQYREDVEQARAVIGPNAPKVSFLRKFYNHPGFIHPMTANVEAALGRVPAERQAHAHIVFTAHSIPKSMAQMSNYEAQLLDACQLVMDGLGKRSKWRLVYQSRSGSPQQPWLEPDINDYIKALHQDGVQDIIVVPIGFISDHMEVLFDLDTEAHQLAQELRVNLVRAATVGTDPQFISMIRELIVERMNLTTEKCYLGALGASHDVCPANCCLPVQQRPTALSAVKPA